jgi:hypothetical protein
MGVGLEPFLKHETQYIIVFAVHATRSILYLVSVEQEAQPTRVRVALRISVYITVVYLIPHNI